MMSLCHKIVVLNAFCTKSIIVENKYLMKNLEREKIRLKH